MSARRRVECGARLVLKTLELIISLYLVIMMYSVGPHWMLLVASVAVPIYTAYLATARGFRIEARHVLPHSVPYLRYRALARARTWKKADLAIGLSMSIVSCGFSAILFFGYFKFLRAAIAAMSLAFIYIFDALLAVWQLKRGSIDFPPHAAAAATAFSQSFGGGNNPKIAAAPPPQQRTLAQPPTPIKLPESSSADAPTILEHMRTELHDEQQQQRARDHRRIASWFDDEPTTIGDDEIETTQRDVLTNSTSASHSSSGERALSSSKPRGGGGIGIGGGWTSNAKIGESLGASTASIGAPTLGESARSLAAIVAIADATAAWPHNHRPTELRSLTSRVGTPRDAHSPDELPPPPSPTSGRSRGDGRQLDTTRSGITSSSSSTPTTQPSHTYKLSSQPYARRHAVPTTAADSKPPLAPPSTRDDEQPASIYYARATARIHPPAFKARLVQVDDATPRSNETSRGSSEGSTARLDDLDRSLPLASSVAMAAAIASTAAAATTSSSGSSDDERRPFSLSHPSGKRPLQISIPTAQQRRHEL